MATSLKAIVTAIDTAAPTTPKPAATDAAPAMALIPDESVAVISTLVRPDPAGAVAVDERLHLRRDAVHGRRAGAAEADSHHAARDAPRRRR